MAGTRSSARLASHQKSSPPQSTGSPQTAAGSKRKSDAGSSPTAKRGRKAPIEKPQKTIEETMDIERPSNTRDNPPENGNISQSEKDAQPQDTMIEQAPKPEESEQNGGLESQSVSQATESKNGEQQEPENIPEKNGDEAVAKHDDKADDKGGNPVAHSATSKMDDTGKINPTEDSKPESHQPSNSGAQTSDAVESHARDEETPASILEKGVIYFFIRGRVGIDNPSDVGDVARSYIILRPIPHGAKIGDGPIGDGGGKCRLLALPKKVLPLSGKDKFMTFVEKSKTTFKELRDEFMSASDYETKTAGVRHTPSVTPIAEGVYALTTTGRESHLAYMITIPQELGEVQKDLGLRTQGSYITSAKNPQYAGPANTNLPQGPDFPKEISDEFRSLRWAPLQPKYLDYENTQFLLIGEDGLENATEQQPKDEKAGKETPKEELEKLEGEDEIRIKNLKGDDAVFADLGISKKEYSQVPTTWSD